MLPNIATDIVIHQRCPPSTEHPFNLRINIPPERVFTAPSILATGGLNSYDPRKANGMGSAAERLIGRRHLHDTTLQILTCQHPLDIPMRGYLDFFATRNRFSIEELPTENYAATFSTRYLSGLYQDFFDETLEIKEKDFDLCLRNCRKINVMTYSYGALIAKSFNNLLASSSYTPEEKILAEKQFLLVDCAGIAPIGSNKSNTTFRIINMQDEEIPKYCNNIKTISQTLDNADKSVLRDNGILIKTIEDETIIIVSSFDDMERSSKSGDFLDPETGSICPTFREFVADSSQHHIAQYTSLGLGRHGLMLPTMIASILTNAVNNSVLNTTSGDGFIPLPENPLELLKPPSEVAFARNSFETSGAYADPAALAKAINYQQRLESITR